MFKYILSHPKYEPINNMKMYELYFPKMKMKIVSLFHFFKPLFILSPLFKRQDEGEQLVHRCRDGHHWGGAQATLAC